MDYFLNVGYGIEDEGVLLFGCVKQPLVVEVVCKKRERGEWGERESFAPYLVTVVTPPPRTLGIHSLPPVSAVFSNQPFNC